MWGPAGDEEEEGVSGGVRFLIWITRWLVGLGREKICRRSGGKVWMVGSGWDTMNLRLIEPTTYSPYLL